MHTLDQAEVLILGGTGSLGQRLFYRILTGELGTPASVTVFSRDEAKQHYMRLDFLHLAEATDDVIYKQGRERIRFAIGDVRKYDDVKRHADKADVIFHAAALKQVPTCEYFGAAAVDTNINGAIHLSRALREGRRSGVSVVGISTDKACKPVNLMGMTKAIQERILIQANLECDGARFVNVRYGNVMASRGSAIPFFIDLVKNGRTIPITDERMTRFCMTLDQSVTLIFNALSGGRKGETYIPMVPSARMVDVARAVAGRDDYPLTYTGVRPGEKIHEVLVSEEEEPRTVVRGENLVILPILPELREPMDGGAPLPFTGEYSSANDTLPPAAVLALLEQNRLTLKTLGDGSSIKF